MILQRLVLYTIFLILIGFVCAPTLSAQVSVNNKVGIHILQPSDDDLKQAAALVNSSGGDWGYVTLVIQENDRDTNKWQEIFDRLRRLHLIPVVRLATSPQGDKWRRPETQDADVWVEFLDSLHWVVKNRHLILFNEPNHGQEWGGSVDPLHYAEVAYAFGQKLKEKNQDFFIMLAGFDAAAPSKPPLFEDEAIFLENILKSSTFNLNSLDGWASHSYPNHGFVGTPYDVGRNSIRTYRWELALLKELGVNKNLPVFISETGWPHSQHQMSKIPAKRDALREKNQKSLYYSPEKVAEYMKTAYEVWLLDKRVAAVTPFVFNYLGEPFAVFSWKLATGDGFYPQYETVKNIPKKKGEPLQEHKMTVVADRDLPLILPKELTINSIYDFQIELQNLGQAILDRQDGYGLSVVNLINKDDKGFDYWFSDFADLAPFTSQKIDFYLKTKAAKGSYDVKIQLQNNERAILDIFSWHFAVVGPPSLIFGLTLFPKITSNTQDIELQVFDQDNRLVFQKKHLSLKNGYGFVEAVNNIGLGKKYRLVVLKPYYLPRQTFLVFHKNQNTARFKTILPVDFNRDGRLSLGDIGGLLKNVWLLKLWSIR